MFQSLLFQMFQSLAQGVYTCFNRFCPTAQNILTVSYKNYWRERTLLCAQAQLGPSTDLLLQLAQGIGGILLLGFQLHHTVVVRSEQGVEVATILEPGGQGISIINLCFNSN